MAVEWYTAPHHGRSGGDDDALHFVAGQNEQDGEAHLCLNGPSDVPSNHMFVSGGQQIHASIWTNATTGSRVVGLRVVFFSHSNTQISQESTTTTVNNATYKQLVIGGTAPSGTKYFVCQVFVQQGSSATMVHFDDAYARVRIGAGLIEAGTLNADDITAGTIDAQKVNIVNLTVTNAMIQSVSATKITTGSMHGNRITAGTLNADRISGGTINATVEMTSPIIKAGPVTLDSTGLRILQGTGTANRIRFHNTSGQVVASVFASSNALGLDGEVFFTDGLSGSGPLRGQPVYSGTSTATSNRVLTRGDHGLSHDSQYIGKSVSTWHQSSDGRNRLFWGNNSHTYIRGSDIIFWNTGGADVGRWQGTGRFVANHDAYINGTLDVGGTKNAIIPDPNDNRISYRFAAAEADEPGVMIKRFSNIVVGPGQGQQVRIPIPEHFPRIGKDPMVFVSFKTPPTAGAGQVVAVVEGWDTGNPEIVITGPQAVYNVLLTFCRDDVGANGWEHVVSPF